MWYNIEKRGFCGGFGTFHVDECWVGYGHYDLRPNCFPDGKPALKAAVDKAHAKGLTCDVHTLTSSVGFYDSWVTPEATEGFVVTVGGKGTFVAEGGEQNQGRKSELTEKLVPVVQELRELGMTKEEWDALWEGGESRA